MTLHPDECKLTLPLECEESGAGRCKYKLPRLRFRTEYIRRSEELNSREDRLGNSMEIDLRYVYVHREILIYGDS